MAYGGPRAATDLFAPVLLASQLHLAHAAGADGLAQDPLARLGGNGGARSCLLGSGRLLVLVMSRVAMAVSGRGVGRGRGRPIAWDGRGRHVGLGVGVVMAAVGARAVAAMWLAGGRRRCRLGAPGGGR